MRHNEIGQSSNVEIFHFEINEIYLTNGILFSVTKTTELLHYTK